jgi:hypothetical protein
MNRINREKKTVSCMIALYCRNLHGGKGGLCRDCAAIHAYALARLDSCPYGIHKTTCRLCATHCYKPEMREKIRAVMRYAGPRMIMTHPSLAIFHLGDSLRRTSKPRKPGALIF